MLMTLAQMRLEQYERCAGPVPITITVGTICERCSFEVFRWQDHDWVHSAEEVATMRRMAAGGPWVEK